MAQIDREGTFKAKLVDYGVTLTKESECPQFVASFVALQIYDEEEGIWIDYTPYDVNEINGYFVLFSKDAKETLTSQQVKKATGWDGASFASLDEGDYSNLIVQIRVEYNTYDGKTTLQVAWIDSEDAVPGVSVKKLDPSELKNLDAKFATLMKKTTKPVTKKGSKPTSPKGPVVKKTTKKKEATPVAEAPSTTAPPASVAEAAAPPVAVPAVDNGPDAYTKQDAWNSVQDLKRPDVTDQKMAETWLGAIKEVSGANDQDKVTDLQWGQILKVTLNEIGLF